jgi:hypothetical protein
MTTDDQGKEKTPQERLDEIKREEKEDASNYYSQGSSKDNVDEEAELSRPVAPIEQAHEEMNMLKAVAFLGFGMAALAIIFILFFVRDLDSRVIGMDGTVTSLEEKIAPLQKNVDDGFVKVNKDISGLRNKVGNYERMMAVMELKRTLVTVQEMSMGNSPNVKAKSGEVVAVIESLLTELGAGPSSTQGMPAGVISLEEAPANISVVEEPTAEPAAEQPTQAETVLEEPAQAETVVEEPTQAETVLEESAQAETVVEEPAQAETVVEEPTQAETVIEPESSESGDESEDEEEEDDDE